MSRKNNKRLQSTEKDTNSGSASPTSPSSSDISLSKYYQHINQLPLNKFIDVVVDGNIYALVISGDPTKDQLLQAWNDIVLQFADAIKDQESRLFFQKERELNIIRLTHHQILECIKLLERIYAKQFADMLNRLLGSSFKFNVLTAQEYDKELRAAYSRSKGIKIDMNLKEMAYEKMKQKFEETGKKPTREYYQGVLITLSDYARYPILETTITVYEFCERIRRINYINDQQKMKKNNGKRK